MPDPDAYIALMTSLPNPERLFRAKQPAISRLRLDRRLTVLRPIHREILAEIESVMAWRSYGMADGDDVAFRRSKALLQRLEEGTLRAIVTQRMDLRAVMAAFRQRRDGKGPPSSSWLQGGVARHIVSHWSDPTFKLDTRLPWIRETAQLFDQQDPLALERQILDVTHRQLQRHGASHSFDFEAVVIYVLKWSIFDRWARSNPHDASVRFETLAHEALGDFADLELKGAI